MKRLLILALILSMMTSQLLISCQKKQNDTPEETTPSETTTPTPEKVTPKMTTCMSFNILGIDGDPPGMAPGRKRFPYVVELIRRYDPDIICIQEANHSPYDWCKTLSDEFCSDGTYGVTTYEQETGIEQTVVNGLMIFYKTEIFDLVESGGQVYKKNLNGKRGFHWVELHDKRQNKDVFVTNTHWSIDRDQKGNLSAEAGDADRTRQAEQLLSFWNETVKDNILFACGDYNCNMSSKWFGIVSEGIYKDGKIVKKLDTVGNVDHCFINPNAVRLLHYGYITDKFTMDGKEYRYSDHTPVFVRVRY